MRRVVVVFFLLLVVGVAQMAWPERALADPSDFPTYTGDEFKALYDYAIDHQLPRLTPPGERTYITGDADLDARIWERAFERGYVLRHVASGGLTAADGGPMQPQAAAACAQLKAAARNSGMRFIVSSAYRSPDAQRTQFLSKLGGTSDSAIDAALTWWSIPGTSKHHSGYALDFRYADGTFGEFRTTPDYAWLAADNFYNAKRFGFIPSYPDDGPAQGPNPEPWEFVWVGVDLIRCGTPVAPAEIGPATGPIAHIVAEVAACPGTLISPGEAVEGLPTWWHRLA